MTWVERVRELVGKLSRPQLLAVAAEDVKHERRRARNRAKKARQQKGKS